MSTGPTLAMPGAALNRWIIDSATDFAIIATDREARVTTWNEGAHRILGWSEEEMLGEVVDRIFTPEDVAASRPAIEMEAALTCGAGNDERWHNRKDGERFWAAGEMTVLRDDAGDAIGFVKVLRDLTEQRRALESLQQADEARAAVEKQLRDLNADLERQVLSRSLDRGMTWHVSPDLLAVLDQEGRFFSANPSWTSLLGWTEAELLPIKSTTLIHPDDLGAGLNAMQDLFAGKPITGFENRQRHKDGSYRWVQWVAVPEGDKIYIRGRDITGERIQAGALEHAQDALRQSQKIEAIGQLTGGVAHDFNNLLTVIRGSVDLLRRPGLSDDRRARYIDAIADTADRAAKLTGQLLAFARRQALKPVVFDAAANLHAVRGMIGSLAGSRIRIAFAAPEQPCFIKADPSQFDTAIVNMAVNARDAMGGEGLLELIVGTAHQIPAVRSHPAIDGEFVTVKVKDSGTGIEPDALIRIFEPFYTTKGVGQGTGLGLSQVFGFAKQSGGDIIVDSEPGVGTIFTLYLPQEVGHEDGAEQAAADDGYTDPEGMCVLVVEDNADVGQFATTTLAELGYATIYAENAEAALRELEKDASRFDVVFSDVVMPGMSGLDMAKLIRERHPDLPVALTSGYSHVLAEQGSDGFDLLHKPYSMEQVSRFLRTTARRRASEATA